MKMHARNIQFVKFVTTMSLISTFDLVSGINNTKRNKKLS